MQKTAKAFPADIQKVDFHMHSGFSDGTDTVEALLAKVKKAGIDAFSLTVTILSPDAESLPPCFQTTVRRILCPESNFPPRTNTASIIF